MNKNKSWFEEIGWKEAIFAFILVPILQFPLMWLFDWKLNWPSGYGYLFGAAITAIVAILVGFLFCENKNEHGLGKII